MRHHLAPGSSRDPGRRPIGHVRAAVAAAALGVLLVACTGAKSNGHYRYPREVAYGRPSTCPDVRMAPLRDGNVSPDAARCSYADANGAKVTHLAGKVLAEGGPGDPGTAVPDVKVTVHAATGPVFNVEAPGPVLAHATTDAQGNYSLRGVFVAGDYAIVVREPTGERITERVVRVEPDSVGSIRDLRVMVPIDPRLRAEAATPPTPGADPRLKVSVPPAPAATPTSTPAAASTSKAATPTSTPATTSSSTPAPTPTSPTAPARPQPEPLLRMRPPAR